MSFGGPLGWPGGVASSYATCYLDTAVASHLANLHGEFASALMAQAMYNLQPLLC